MLFVFNIGHLSKKRQRELFINCLEGYEWEPVGDFRANMTGYPYMGFVSAKKSEIIYFEYHFIRKSGLLGRWEDWKVNRKKYPELRAIRK